MGLQLMEFPSVPAAFQRYTETNRAGTNGHNTWPHQGFRARSRPGQLSHGSGIA